MKMVRIQFELPKEKVNELEELMKEAKIPTRKDLFNNALTLLEWAINEKSNGRIIAGIDEENNSFRELVMPPLQAIKRRKEMTASKTAIASKT